MARCIAKTAKGTQCEKTAVKGSKYCQVHRNRRNWWRALSLSAIGVFIVGALGIISNITGILGFIGITWNPFNNSQRPVLSSFTPTPQNPQTDIELVTTNDQRILMEADKQVITPGGAIKLGASLTVTFTIINNGANLATIKSLVIGARGPGVSCQDKNDKRLAAPNMPFPSPANIVLQPGQEYKYEGSRAFYIAGNYTFEPVMQGPNGDWGGIAPFACVDLNVQ